MAEPTRDWTDGHSPRQRDWNQDLIYVQELEVEAEMEERDIEEIMFDLYSHAWRRGFVEGQKPPYPGEKK